MSVRLNSPSALRPPGCGCLQRHCPCETLPSHTNHGLTKTKEITAAWFSSAVFCTLSSGWPPTHSFRDSNMFSTVLVSKRGGRVPSAYCFVTQIVNNPMEKQVLPRHGDHTLYTICSGLNGRGNYRQLHGKTATVNANLVKGS